MHGEKISRNLFNTRRQRWWLHCGSVGRVSDAQFYKLIVITLHHLVCARNMRYNLGRDKPLKISCDATIMAHKKPANMLSILNVSFGIEPILSVQWLVGFWLLLQQRSENNMILTRHRWTKEMTWYNLFRRTHAHTQYIVVGRSCTRNYVQFHITFRDGVILYMKSLHMRHDYQIK